jgi:carboxypeptidase Q
MSRRVFVLSLSAFCILAGALLGADVNIPAQYAAPSKQLIDAALADTHSLDRLEYLCDRIGNRLSGSPSLDVATSWAAGEMRKAGLQNVRTAPVKVPHWVRGAESAVMLSPISRRLPILGLGNSVGTPPEGISAEVVVVSNFDELASLKPEQVRAKIVLYDAPYQGYGRTVAYRIAGASRAAGLGAAAVLVRSVTPLSLRDPHTGTLIYDEKAPRVPAAAVTVEDAEAIHRLVNRGVNVRVQLTMAAHFEPDVESANVIGEIPGSENPDEVVVLGGHIDSWDVGQGAQDDGSGIMASLEAVSLIQKLGLKPRRTIRLVFWVNEENGGAGGKAYRGMIGPDVSKHVAAIEMDGGAEKPMGFGASLGHPTMPGSAAPAGEALSPKAFDRLQAIGSLLAHINASQITHSGGGSDIEPLMESGVPGLGEISSGAHYFDWHHSEADTFDKINPQDFRESVAAMAVMTFVLADMPERLADLK